MRRLLFLLGMFLAGLAVAAAAQVMAPGAMRMRSPAISSNTAARVDPASDPVLARAAIDRLTRKNAELTTIVADLRQKLDQATKPGGTLVTAFCGSDTVSRNTAGASQDCSYAGYTCEPVSGQCRNSCQTSDQCSPGFLCDTGIERCVRP